MNSASPTTLVCSQGPTATTLEVEFCPTLLRCSINFANPPTLRRADAAACLVSVFEAEGPRGWKHLVWSGCKRRLVPVRLPPPLPLQWSWARETRRRRMWREATWGIGGWSTACARARMRERADGEWGRGRKPGGRELTAAAPWPPLAPQAPATRGSEAGCLVLQRVEPPPCRQMVSSHPPRTDRTPQTETQTTLQSSQDKPTLNAQSSPRELKRTDPTTRSLSPYLRQTSQGR